MLFDLRSGARRRTVKVVYLGLALLMFVGFVGFSIGSSGLSGGIGRRDHRQRRQRRRRHRRRRAPDHPGPDRRRQGQGHADRRRRLGRARPGPRPPRQVGDNLDTATGDYTAEGRRQLAAAGTAWDKYVALNPPTPDERLARQMAQAFLSVGNADKAVTAQEIVTEIDPTQQTFSNLAIFAYQAGQTRKGDLAAAKAVDLAPKDEQKDLKTQLDSAKTQAATQQIQQAAPTPTPTVGG